MKLLIITSLLFSFMHWGSAQSINKQVISTSGNTISNATYQLTSTVGETLIGLKSATVSINQGFLAGATSGPPLTVEDILLKKSVKIYPNPVTDLVYINIPENQENITATVYNLVGKQVASQPIRTAKQALELSHLASGMYLIQLHFKESNLTQSFKIIKK